ncbi:hypothetical protein FC83_GL001301 [Agrilactobacillus composti DSM 18527 = JCM 14202]|uniref:HTH tetR-type domain-containing protein n=2 Tax=Agrilactobacillus TaxID=2767875 RepID=A0A0R1Y055_9LACO|nr:hypothetical protein [Agrilactobacillus composti]KRM35173.1 hypothetical protein FC83_GL001301 [Agrilactobacillus composti DSM 18527 = JCM 14202]
MKRYIEDTLAQYLTTHTVDKLRVCDIIAVTGVSRSGFYRLYPMGVNELCYSVVMGVLKLEQQEFKDWQAAMDFVITEIETKPRLFLNIYRLSLVIQENLFLKKAFLDFVCTYFNQDPFFKPIQPAHLAFFADALRWQISEWLAHDLSEPGVKIRARLGAFALLQPC